MSLTTPATLKPVAAGERIATLDIARGIALFGIFMVNIQFMAQPMNYMFEGGGADEGVIAKATHLVTRVFFESKSYPLFSMLFGMGMMLMYDRAKSAGRDFTPTYLRRLALLLTFGIAHAFLVWFGDILIYYACFALVIMWFAPLKPRTMATVGIALIVLASVWATLLGVGFAMLTGMGERPPGPEVTTFSEFWAAMREGKIQGGPELPAWAAAEYDAFHNGPFINAVGMRAINWLTGTIFWLVVFGVVFHVPGLFLLGGAIMRSGILTDPESPWMKRFLLIGLCAGLPGSILIVSLGELLGPMSPQAMAGAGLVCLFGPMISLGYIGLAMWLSRSGFMGWLTRAVANAGRMALTNYLMQSLLIAALCQHWGLGWYGDVGRAQMLGLVVGIYAGQLILSTLWLQAFTMGPLEYVWRCGTYLKLPRITKRPPTAS